METCLAPHRIEESKNFLGRNLPRHTNDQDMYTKQRGGGVECRRFVFLICHLALRRSWGRPELGHGTGRAVLMIDRWLAWCIVLAMGRCMHIYHGNVAR